MGRDRANVRSDVWAQFFRSAADMIPIEHGFLSVCLERSAAEPSLRQNPHFRGTYQPGAPELSVGTHSGADGVTNVLIFLNFRNRCAALPLPEVWLSTV